MPIDKLTMPPPLPGTPFSDATQDEMVTAQQIQAQNLLSEERLPILAARGNNNSVPVMLDMPGVNTSTAEYTGFFNMITNTLAELSGLLGDMADSLQVDLQFKQTEAKRLLKEKLQAIEQREQRRQEAIAAEQEMQAHRKKAGIFGSIMNFMFAAAEVFAGAAMIVGGALSANPALIAGGSMLVAAGALDVAAEVLKLQGGNEKTIEKLEYAAMGLMISGIVIGSIGAASAAAPAMAGLKAGAKAAVKKGAKAALKAGKEAAEKATKEAAEKATKEAAEATVNKSSKQFLEKTYKTLYKNAALLATATELGNKAYSIYMTTQERDYEVRAAQLEADIAELHAKFEETIANQTLVNQMIQLLMEQWTRALAGPVQEALKILNETIQDHGNTSRRIAASFSA